MESIQTEEILNRITAREKKAKLRAALLTFIPLVFAIILITYTSKKIAKAQTELQTIDSKLEMANNKVKQAEDSLYLFKQQSLLLKKENDSLLKNVHESLGKAVSVMSEFKGIIDKIKPELRSIKEAAFYTNFRMMEERIRGDYSYLSQKIDSLPPLHEDEAWVTIVQSSVSLDDLKSEVANVASIYGQNQIAIYKSANQYYALCVIGNGTFTRAYRINVELRDKYNRSGVYFTSSKDWGKNYLLN
jgi:hypothetical protein